MQVRIVAFSDKYEGYKLKGYDEIDDLCELVKTLCYMKENEIPIIINTEDLVDTDGEEYYIQDINVVFPRTGGELESYVSVFVEEF